MNQRNRLSMIIHYLFRTMTRKEAKEKIENFKKENNRPPTKEEKHKIIDKCANKAKTRAIALGLAAVTVGFGANLLGEGKSQKTNTQPTEEVETNLSAEDDNILNEQNAETNKFLEELKVDVTTGVPYNNNVEEQKNPELAAHLEQINNIDSKSDVLSWFKGLYASEYEKATGEKISASLKIIKSSSAYIYQAGEDPDGNPIYVTHGATPYATENAIASNGETPIRIGPQIGREFAVYTIYDGDIPRESIVYFIEDGKYVPKPVTPANVYIEGKSCVNNVLATLGMIPKNTIETYCLYNGNAPEYAINDGKGELKNGINKFYAQNEPMQIDAKEENERG